MKILITGASGQLGKDLVDILGHHCEVIGLDKGELDVTDLENARSLLKRIRPNVVIHAAAFTQVDLAESAEEVVYKVNALGTRNMTMASEEIHARICYISTDYVFDGQSNVPYKEYDNTNPVGVYGKSKRAGEQFVQTLSTQYFIVRSSWIYGNHGENFVKTMLKLAESKESLKVVDDQIGSPTYTIDLAHFLMELINTEYYGIYHASNTGSCSWYEFAKAIFEESGVKIILEACTTEEFPRSAPRPKYSVLDHMAIRTQGMNDLRHWREALKAFLKSKIL